MSDAMHLFPELRISLVAVDRALADAWHAHCGDLPGVEVVRGSILDLECDAAVSPANSFGFMNGGIDSAYTMHFGSRLEARVRAAIAELHHGELLVGAAEIVHTDDARIPYLIAAPTMRVPQALRNSVNPYLAMRAVLLLIRHGNLRFGAQTGRPVRELVRHVAVPGLGTGVGEVDPRVCAQQVRAAIVGAKAPLLRPRGVGLAAHHPAGNGHADGDQ